MAEDRKVDEGQDAASKAGESIPAGKGVWWHRGRRMATSANMALSILLAAGALFLVNRLAWHYNQRWNISWDNYYALSDKTMGMIASLEDNVEITALYQKSHPLYNDVYRLLREYEYADARVNAQRRLNVEIIDTDRDLAEAREKAIRYDVHKPNVVIFDVKGRTKYVEAKDLSDYKYELLGGQAVKTRLSFKGEQEFSSAILSVSQAARPKVYFLTGHGERSITDYGSQAGFSRVATLLRRDNMAIQPLLLNDSEGVPEDCSLLVVAGADRKISDAEIDMISKYLGKNGRLLCLLDPAVRTGLEPLLAEWGVKLAEDVVVGPSLSGRDLIINEYGDHPSVKKLKDLTTMFFMPRSVEPVEGHSAAVVTASDKAAVEKGAMGGIDVEIKPTRIVVIGDSYFVSNGTLEKAVGGNVDFLMSTVSWLLERESLMAISSKSPYELRLEMNSKELRMMTLSIVLILPGLMGIVGFAVWLRRRA